MPVARSDEWAGAFLAQAEVDFEAAKLFHEQNYVNRPDKGLLADADGAAALATSVMLYLQSLEKALKAVAVGEVGTVPEVKSHDSLQLIVGWSDKSQRGSRGKLRSTVEKALAAKHADGVQRVLELQGYTPGSKSAAKTGKNTEYPWEEAATQEIRLPRDAVTLRDLTDAQYYAKQSLTLARNWLRRPRP